MDKKKHLGIALLAGIVIATVVRFSRPSGVYWQEGEPAYHGHGLGWWVDMYYNNEYHPERKAEVEAALSAIGTNAVPYLISWFACVDSKPSQPQRSASSSNQHLPTAMGPDFLVSWADEQDFSIRMWTRARAAAAACRLLGARNQCHPLPPHPQSTGRESNQRRYFHDRCQRVAEYGAGRICCRFGRDRQS